MEEEIVWLAQFGELGVQAFVDKQADHTDDHDRGTYQIMLRV